MERAKYDLSDIREVVNCINESLVNGLNGKCKSCSRKELCDLLYELVVCGYRMCSDLMHGAVMHTILEVERTRREQMSQEAMDI